MLTNSPAILKSRAKADHARLQACYSSANVQANCTSHKPATDIMRRWGSAALIHSALEDRLESIYTYFADRDG